MESSTRAFPNTAIDGQGSVLATLTMERSDTGAFSDASKPQPENAPTKFDHAIWALGWTDGRSRDDEGLFRSEEFFINEARLWALQRKIEIEAEKATRTASCASLEKERAQRLDELDGLRRMQADVAAHSLRYNPKFSLAMALVLSLLGALLLLADIPLTAQLATRSLGFADAVCVDSATGVSTPYDPIGGCVAPLHLERVESGSLGWNGFTRFRDVLFLAMALAACSFVVKLLMDALNNGDFRKGSDHVARAWMLSSVCLLFAALLVILGLVRHGGFEAETVVLEKQRDGFNTALATLKNAAQQNSQTSAEIQRFTNLVDQWTAKISGRRSGPVKWGFILLTIVFPLVSGVLVHQSVQYWHHWHAAKMAPTDLSASEQKVTEANDRLLTETMAASGLTALESTLENDDVSIAIARRWHGLYLHGRSRGAEARSTFDSTASYFDRALHVIDRRLA